MHWKTILPTQGNFSPSAGCGQKLISVESPCFGRFVIENSPSCLVKQEAWNQGRLLSNQKLLTLGEPGCDNEQFYPFLEAVGILSLQNSVLLKTLFVPNPHFSGKRENMDCISFCNIRLFSIDFSLFSVRLQCIFCQSFLVLIYLCPGRQKKFNEFVFCFVFLMSHRAKVETSNPNIDNHFLPLSW